MWRTRSTIKHAIMSMGRKTMGGGWSLQTKCNDTRMCGSRQQLRKNSKKWRYSWRRIGNSCQISFLKRIWKSDGPSPPTKPLNSMITPNVLSRSSDSQKMLKLDHSKTQYFHPPASPFSTNAWPMLLTANSQNLSPKYRGAAEAIESTDGKTWCGKDRETGTVKTITSLILSMSMISSRGR